MTVRNERYVCSASVVLSGHKEEEEESLQLAKTPWMDGPTGGVVWFSFCRWGNPPDTIRDINALKKEEERTQGAAVVLRVRCELKNGLFARNGPQGKADTTSADTRLLNRFPPRQTWTRLRCTLQPDRLQDRRG